MKLIPPTRSGIDHIKIIKGNNMKRFLIISSLLIFALSVATCRSATKLKPDKKKYHEHDWGGFSPLSNTTSNADILDRMNWASARQKIKDMDYIDHIRYIKDDRTDLCFAIFKDFGFQRIPCGYIESVLE